MTFPASLRKVTKTKTLPPRPPPAKTGPGRPPPPCLQSAGQSQSWNTSQKQGLPRKCPVLPPRPNPGHRLYNKYMVRYNHSVPWGTMITSLMQISLSFLQSLCFSFYILHQLPLPHGIAAVDHNGKSTGGLSFQVFFDFYLLTSNTLNGIVKFNFAIFFGFLFG